MGWEELGRFSRFAGFGEGFLNQFALCFEVGVLLESEETSRRRGG